VQATNPTSPIRDFDAKIIKTPAAIPAAFQLRFSSSIANRTMMTPSKAAKGDQGA